MANQILRLTKFSGKDAVAMAQQQIKHDLRMYDVTNADRKKANENEVFIINKDLVHINDETPVKDYDFGSKPPGKIKEETTVKFSDAFNAHVKEQCGEDYKVRSNAIKAIEVLMTASPDVPKGFDWDAWANDSMAWAEKEFGRENITLAVFHKDEHTPHIHLQFIPVRDGRLNGTFYCGRASALRTLQRSYAKVTEKHRLNHRKINTRARHEDIKHFYAQMNKVIDFKVPEKDFLESDKQYQERIMEWAKDFKMSVFAHAKKLENESREAIKESREAIKDIREYEHEVDEMDARIRRFAAEVRHHEKQYNAMEALQYMVKKGFFDDEAVELMREAMRRGRKELNRMTEQEKKDFWEGPQVVPEKEYNEPPINIDEINEEYEPPATIEPIDNDFEYEL